MPKNFMSNFSLTESNFIILLTMKFPFIPRGDETKDVYGSWNLFKFEKISYWTKKIILSFSHKNIQFKLNINDTDFMFF